MLFKIRSQVPVGQTPFTQEVKHSFTEESYKDPNLNFNSHSRPEREFVQHCLNVIAANVEKVWK